MIPEPGSSPPACGRQSSDDQSSTVRALGAMSAARSAGAVVHSYLDDGLAMQFDNYGNYLAWAALESYLVEGLAGARLTHCYGGLVPQPAGRAPPVPAPQLLRRPS